MSETGNHGNSGGPSGVRIERIKFVDAGGEGGIWNFSGKRNHFIGSHVGGRGDDGKPSAKSAPGTLTIEQDRVPLFNVGQRVAVVSTDDWTPAPRLRPPARRRRRRRSLPEKDGSVSPDTFDVVLAKIFPHRRVRVLLSRYRCDTLREYNTVQFKNIEFIYQRRIV